MAIFTLSRDWSRMKDPAPLSAFTVANRGEFDCEFIFATDRPIDGGQGVDWDIYTLPPGEMVRIAPNAFSLPLWGRAAGAAPLGRLEVLTRLAVDFAGLKTIFPLGEGNA